MAELDKYIIGPTLAEIQTANDVDIIPTDFGANAGTVGPAYTSTQIETTFTIISREDHTTQDTVVKQIHVDNLPLNVVEYKASLLKTLTVPDWSTKTSKASATPKADYALHKAEFDTVTDKNSIDLHFHAMENAINAWKATPDTN